MAETSSLPSKADKHVIVRVKRKVSQSRLDAFWLEINERPLKRPLLDFGKLSISDSSTNRVEEPRTTKILVQHLETVTSSRETSVALRSFVPNLSEALKVKDKNEDKRFKSSNKQNELRLKAKQQQEVLSRNARFEQIWRSRKEKKEAPEVESVYETYRVYDVVRVDIEEEKIKMLEEKKVADMDDYKMMAQYLPLLQEVLPSAVKEIKEDVHDYISKQASSDGYVYDFYAVNEDASTTEIDSASQFPLIQVDDDDDFYDGPDDDSDYPTDDSNAEDHPLNDYPDEEEISEDEDEVTSRSSEEKSEVERKTSGNESPAVECGSDEEGHHHEVSRPHNWSEDANQFYEYEAFDSDGEGYVDTCYHDHGDTCDPDYSDDEW